MERKCSGERHKIYRATNAKIDSLNVEFSFLSALMSAYFIAVNADYAFHRLDLFLPYLRRELIGKRKYQ